MSGSGPTIPNDLEIYDRHGAEWWDPASRVFASLRRVSEFRLAVLRGWIGAELRGARVVDLGCGGGLLSEPLAEDGARVVGVDRSVPSLRCAAGGVRGAGRYVCGDVTRVPLHSARADLVLLADVLEHVADPAAAIAEAARVLRVGGALYVNTISRTLRARFLVVHLAETVGLIPRGTHDATLFLRPERLEALAAAAGLRRVELVGEAPDLRATLRERAIALRPTRSVAVGYSALFRKDPGATRR
jgi:2-polyprenyl-6-hydroxyphenyl methylase/3-demethylubiquinone-9 3-methyltransferase